MDKLPTTTFTWSPDTEVDRVLVTARSIYNNFYPDNKFVILPNLDSPGDASRVVFPDLEYSKIDNFWENIGILKNDIPIKAPPDLFRKLNKLLKPQIKNIDNKLVKSRNSQWNKKQYEYWQFIESIFPNEIKLIESIEVRITNYGTISSISLIKGDKPQKLVVYLRQDANISHLAAIIIKTLLHYTSFEKYSWRERMGIADFFMNNTKLKDLFPDHQHIINALDNVKDNNFNKSKVYLNKLNVKFKVKPLGLIDNKIYSNGANIESIFTKREKRIMKELLHHQKIIGFDEVADILWRNEEDYSLWAMNKAMQRIRKKLVEIGLPENSLVTKRKQGYYLNI